MRRHQALRALFRSASSVVLLANCGGTVEPTAASGPGGGKPAPTSSVPSAQPPQSTPQPPPDVPDVHPTPSNPGVNLCDSTELLGFPAFSNVTLANGVDYVELRDDPYGVAQPGMPTVHRIVLGQAGAACAGASDVAACKQKLTAIEATAGWIGFAGGQIAASRRYFAFTRGDEVGVATDIVGFRGVFGATDTVHEAALIATLENYRFDCPSSAPNAWQDGSFSRLHMLYAKDWTCPMTLEDRVIRVGPDGVIAVVTTADSDKLFGCAGRRFEGYMAKGDARSVGEWLAQTAELEAAAVPAFERLTRELAAHGAPDRLVLAARRAREDEVRHAAVMRAHAIRHGSTPAEIEAPALPVRPLLELALENAVEGCVREAFAALVAHVQAARAATPVLRATFAKIADDETRHAALAHDCDEWLASQLTPAERDRVARARARAIAELRVELTRSPDPVSARVLGLPDVASALALLALVEPTLAAA